MTDKDSQPRYEGLVNSQVSPLSPFDFSRSHRLFHYQPNTPSPWQNKLES